MKKRVFYSWQSDRPDRETKEVIRQAIAEAISSIAAEVAEAERPNDASGLVLDHDTKGLAGSPDIASSILAKIDAAAVFIADVTPIALVSPSNGGRPKHVANPNVLIELGYAKKAIGPERIIQVWNTSFTNCGPEDLPFDMRGRRGPIQFSLEHRAPSEHLRAVRKELSKQLKSAIHSVLALSPEREEIGLHWKAGRADDPAVWFEKGAKLIVNEPFHGSGTITLFEAPSRYIRMLPERWTRSHFKAPYAAMLGHTAGISSGQTRGGFLTYSGSIVRPELAEGRQATMWFMDTGEVWAVDRWIVTDWQGRSTIFGDDLFPGWKSFIEAQLAIVTSNGGKLPIHVRLGASGLSGSHWPVRSPAFGAPQALEDQFQSEFTIVSASLRDWGPSLVDAWARFREIYSMPPPTPEEVRSLLGI